MRFDWREFLVLAWELLGRRNRRARQRSAISRAYYAAFITARIFLEEVEGVRIIRQDAHFFVAEYFVQSGDPQRQEIGRLLRRMRNARNRADYDTVFPNLQNTAFDVANDAEDVIAAIERL